MEIVVKKRVKKEEPFVRREVPYSIYVTNHAIERFQHRCRLLYPEQLLTDFHSVIHFLRDKFKEAKDIDFALRQLPGRYNAICTHYGCKVRYRQYKTIIFAWEEIEDGVRIRTVFRAGGVIHTGYRF